MASRQALSQTRKRANGWRMLQAWLSPEQSSKLKQMRRETNTTEADLVREALFGKEDHDPHNR